MSDKKTTIICAFCEERITDKEEVETVNGKTVCKRCYDYMTEQHQ